MVGEKGTKRSIYAPLVANPCDREFQVRRWVRLGDLLAPVGALKIGVVRGHEWWV